MPYAVSYNGIRFENCRIRESSRDVYSDSTRNLKYVEITFSGIGYVYHDDPETQKALKRRDLMSVLKTPGGEFRYEENGTLIFLARPVAFGAGNAQFAYDDVGNGPKPVEMSVIDNWPVTTRVRFSIVVTISPGTQYDVEAVSNGQPGGNRGFNDSIVDHVVDAQYHIDKNNYTTRTISGRIIVASSYGNWHDPAYQLDMFREAALKSSRFIRYSVINPPANFERTSLMFNPMPDQMTLTYTVVDTEMHSVAPLPFTDFDVSVSIRDQGMQLGSVDKHISGYFELPPRVPTHRNVIRMMRRIITTYVLTDPDALVWVETSSLTRTTQKRNHWTFDIQCIHMRSLLYEQGLTRSGLFAEPMNNSGQYNHPKIYGSAGLFGDGYNATQDTELLGDLEYPETTTTNPNSFPLFKGDKVREPNLVMADEKAQVVILHQGSITNVANGQVAITDLTTPGMYICVSGYKMSIDRKPDAVLPENRFNILTSLTGTSSDPIITPKEGGRKLLPAIKIDFRSSSDRPQLSRWEIGKIKDGGQEAYASKLHFYEYGICVRVSKYVYDTLKAQMAAGPDGTIDTFPWPDSLDAIADLIAQKIEAADPKAGLPVPAGPEQLAGFSSEDTQQEPGTQIDVPPNDNAE